MQKTALPASFAEVLEPYSEIYAIVSPPRCSSTAFARVFWEQPSVRYYCHEPFEVTYYMGQDLSHVAEKLAGALDLANLKSYRGPSEGRALVIKEMPYQVGENFPILAALAEKPLIFLMRDPRLNIASRMAKKSEVSEDPIFPAVESGWELWRSQIEWCRANDVPHILVDSTDFRNQPNETFNGVFNCLGLPFAPEMLQWRACPQVELDNLGGRHRHLYGEVLESRGVKPETDEIPALGSFPLEAGWRDHVAHCLTIYREAAASSPRVEPAA